MSTRERITEALAAQRQRIDQWFHALPEAELLRPLTPSEVAEGEMWTAKDHLAHVLAAERFFQGAIKRALGGAEDPLGFYTQTGSDDHKAHLAVINQMNERGATHYRDEPVAALFTRLDETRQATLALLASLDDAQLEQVVAHSPFSDSTIGGLLMMVAQHNLQHIRWLNTAIARRDAPSE